MIVEVTGRRIRVKTKELITARSKGVDKCTFSFDDAWAGLVKTAVFSDGANEIKIAESAWDDGGCTVPWEVLQNEGNTLTVGVFGVDGSGNVVMPTITATVCVLQKPVNMEATEGETPTPTIYEQWVADIHDDYFGTQENKKEIAVMKTDTEAARDAAKTSADEAKSSATSAAAAKAAAETAQAMAEEAQEAAEAAAQGIQSSTDTAEAAASRAQAFSSSAEQYSQAASASADTAAQAASTSAAEAAADAAKNIEANIGEYIDEKLKDYKQDKAAFEKVLLYYGYPIAINGAWSVENAVNIYRTYDICVFGDTYENPEQETYADTCAIFKRLKEVSPATQIVGYVPIGLDPNWPDSNLTMDELKLRVDRWVSIGATGIFLDEFGYDYNVTRMRQNEIVGYCHDKGLFVFANSWEVDYVFSPDPMLLDWIPGFEPNPDGIPPLINENDYYLYENLFYGTEEVSGVINVECASVWRINDVLGYFTRPMINGRSYYDVYKTKICSLDAIPSTIDITHKNILQSISCIGAAILNINAVAFGDEHWGSSGYYHQWDLPALDLGHDGLNGVSEETKAYINDEGEEHSFPYKWSANINGQTYAVVFDIPNPDHREWVDGMRYCTDNDVIVENAWMSIFDFQTSVREATEKSDTAIAIAEQIKVDVDNVMPTLATAEENIKKVVAEAQTKIDEATATLEAGIADLEGVTAGFGFKENQW